ncbi:hypothetical protein P4H94_07385 [Paenibacillus macerans]|uniref:Uncharacterized protein n=1 Tax=Paenibacillus macerans TaxID=44252 RepID=A0A6N8ESS9_PAEMA|nr:hypothetical protein [Paenibacillus macerans]MEC0136707.1 hypothetical protein [Paenibacillus macerans]MED4955982.1 hypothetical protein [Paenibacillus macerans]MUG21803.1 hypothetical protein [Paenibacillus macerans]
MEDKQLIDLFQKTVSAILEEQLQPLKTEMRSIKQEVNGLREEMQESNREINRRLDLLTEEKPGDNNVIMRAIN